MTLIEVPNTHWRPCGASATGRAHLRAGRGNQDAWAHAQSAAHTAIAIADGCSQGPRSELGAHLGAMLAVTAAVRRAATAARADVPGLVLNDVTAELGRLLPSLALTESERAGVAEDALLFTLHVAVADAASAIVFGVGDGVVVVDGVARALSQGPAPDYPAYALFGGAPNLVVHHDGPLQASLVLATDGAHELWSDDGFAFVATDARVLANPSLPQKWLRAWAERARPADDCTLAVLRRRAPDSERSAASNPDDVP